MSAPNSDLVAALAIQRDAAAYAPMPDMAARREDLRRLRAVILKNADALIGAIDRDFGCRSVVETTMSEIAPVVAAIDYAVRWLPKWMRAERKPVPWMFRPGRAWVERRPAGCIGIIAAWNFPLLLSVGPLVDAIAAGNRVMLKASELTPRFSAFLADLLEQIFPIEQVVVVRGDASIGEAFSRLPFDHLLFTGSAGVGEKILRAAAENLTPVTLELGGKCPAILCAGYDPAKAVRAVAAGKFFNAGQVCLAPDYVLAPHCAVDAFGRKIFAQAMAMFPSVQGNRDYTALMGTRHLARLQAALKQLEALGVTILRGEDAVGEGKLSPVVVLNPPLDSDLMQDEIFGPVLPVIGYSDFADALQIVRRNPDPLAIYPFANDFAFVQRWIDAVPTGGVTWNGTVLHGALPGLPFGGVGRSGMGRYHGRDGFERFSRQVSVYKPGFFSGFTAMLPPHGLLAKIVRRAVLRG